MASWQSNIPGSNQLKYVYLSAASRPKAESDLQKYDTARLLHGQIKDIRARYSRDLDSKSMLRRQLAVAIYFMDKVAELLVP